MIKIKKSLWHRFNRTRVMKFVNYLMLITWYYTKEGKRAINKDVVIEAIHEKLINKKDGYKFIEKYNLKHKEERTLNIENAFK